MIPETTLQLARDIIALQARALDEHKMLAAASEQASGAEAVGKAALAAELEQVGKVLANYMPRIMKHVGEIDLLTQPVIPEFLQSVPDDLADLVRENEPHGETRARLLSIYIELQHKLLMGLSNDGDGAMHTRLHRHAGWLTGKSAEVI
jgi:hypothetical protein